MLQFKRGLFQFCTDQTFRIAESVLNQGTNVLAGIDLDSDRWLLS